MCMCMISMKARPTACMTDVCIVTGNSFSSPKLLPHNLKLHQFRDVYARQRISSFEEYNS